jgi:hypothetical protein
MPFTILLFVTRKPSLSPSEFKDYWETKHIPLLKSLTGPLFPQNHTRRYLARINREGFGGPANRDHPLLTLRGIQQERDYDGVAEMTFETKQAFQDFYSAIYEKGTAAKLAEDEGHFLDAGKFEAVVVGETTTTYKDQADGETTTKYKDQVDGVIDEK